MTTIFTLLMILIIIASVLLIIIIMAQNPKGGGLSSAFGGTSSAQFGVQRTNEFMDKATWTLGITIVALILLSVVLTGKTSEVVKPLPTKKETKTTTGTTPIPTSTGAPAETNK